jgi:hypothetical protein
MMRKLLALVLFAVAFCASAQVTVQPSFFGTNLGSDPTAAGYVWPKCCGQNFRAWDTPIGATNAAPKWAASNPSSGNYSFANLNAIVAAIKAHNGNVVYTFGNVPSWVNSTQNLTTQAQLNDLYAFATALMADVGPSGIAYCELWNEFNDGSPWWVGTDAQVSVILQNLYPIAHNNGCTALAPSIGMENNSSSLVPASPYYHLEQVFSGCYTSGLPCFDWLNFHGYPGLISKAVPDLLVVTAPELLPTMVNNYLAVASEFGYGAYPLAVNEGFACVAASDSTTSFDTDVLAGCQARYVIMLASLGVVQEEYFNYGTECATKTACGSSLANTSTNILGMSRVGVALRNIQGWLSGATFTTPMTRVRATNSIRSAVNATSTVGLLSGPGTNCPGGVNTAGTLPLHMYSSNNQSSNGMSLYNAGSGTESSIPYIDFRLCGIDTTSGNGKATASILFDNGITSTPGQNWVTGGYYRMTAGSSANIYQFQIAQVDATSGGSYLADTHYYTLYPVNVSLASQHSEFRSRTDNATTGQMQPQFSIQYQYNGNGTTGTLPIDITIRIGSPTSETGGNSTQWIGNVTEANGTQGIIAWDASNGPSNYTAPAGYNAYRDIYGVSHAIVGNTVTLTNMPIIIENTAWKGLIH